MTIVTLRPNGLAIASHTTTVVGAGGSSVTATSDNSDASYIQGQVDSQYVRFFLTDMAALPANRRVRSVQIRARTAPDPGNTITTQDTLTRVNDCTASHLGTCLGVARLLIQRGVQTISTQTGPLAYIGPCNKAWDATVVNNLCIETTWFRPVIGNWVFQKVYELYVDVDVNTQPIVSGAPVVTNFTNNAKPTVSWTYFDVDDDPQAAYRLRIFDAATYGAANFDPKTTRATWDSGIVYSTRASVQVPISLLNGVTYRAYVQVAQSWPGPQGSIWWSDPVNSASFTVGFTPPPAPAIQSATILADPNQYRAALSILVPVNLLSIDNSSFETTLGQWAALTNCSVVRDTAQHADGAASMRMTATAAGAMFAQSALDPSGDPRIDGGKTYTILASFRAATTGRACLVGVQWQDGSGANIGAAVYSGSVTDTTSGFTQAALVTSTPSNAYQGKVTVQVQGAAGGEIHYIDKVDIHVGSSITWTPGGYVNDQGDLLVERGEYLDDERGPVDNWFHPQVGSCGTFLRSPGYGFLTSDSRLQWRWLDQVIPWEGETPSGMLDWYPSVQTVPYIRFGDWTYGGTAFMAPAVANQPHTFSVWAWCSVNTVTAQPRIDWRDQDGNIVATAVGANTLLTTTPQRIQVTGTAPPGVVLATGAVALPSSDQTQHLFFTRAGYGIGTLPVDGKMPKGIATGFLPNGLPLGVDWTPVRWRDTGELMSTQAFTGNPPGFNTGQTETIVDYEYTPGRPVLYRASIVYSSQSNVIRSPYSNVAVVYGQPPASTLLRSVTNPMLGVAVNRLKITTVGGGFIGAHPHSISDDAAVFHPLGADAAPIRIRDWVGGDDGQLVAVTVSDAQAHRLMAVVSANDVFQIQWAQGGRTYCLITDRNYAEVLSSDSDYHDIEGQILGYLRHLQFTLSYVETVAP